MEPRRYYRNKEKFFYSFTKLVYGISVPNGDLEALWSTDSSVAGMGVVETGGAEESKKEEVKEEVKQQADGEEKEEDEVCFHLQRTPPAFCTPAFGTLRSPNPAASPFPFSTLLYHPISFDIFLLHICPTQVNERPKKMHKTGYTPPASVHSNSNDSLGSSS
jgi:hypothetical protein